jgi:hypothetical protein
MAQPSTPQYAFEGYNFRESVDKEARMTFTGTQTHGHTSTRSYMLTCTTLCESCALASEMNLLVLLFDAPNANPGAMASHLIVAGSF